MVKNENNSKLANRKNGGAAAAGGGASLLRKATTKRFGASKFALLAMNNGAKPPLRKVKVPLNSSNNLTSNANQKSNNNNNNYNWMMNLMGNNASDADNRSRVSDITGSIGEETLWSRPALVKEVVPVNVDNDFDSDILDMSDIENVDEGREDEDSADSTLPSFTKAYTTPTPAFSRKNNIGTAYKMRLQPYERQQAPTVATAKTGVSKKTVSIAKGLHLSAPSPMTLTRYELQMGQERTAPVSREYVELEAEREKERQRQAEKDKIAQAKKSVHEEFKREIEREQGEGFEAQLNDFDPTVSTIIKKKSLVKQILSKIRPLSPSKKKKQEYQLTEDEARFMARKAIMASNHKRGNYPSEHLATDPPDLLSPAEEKGAAAVVVGEPGFSSAFPLNEVNIKDERDDSVSDLDSSLRKVPVGEIRTNVNNNNINGKEDEEQSVSTLGQLDHILSDNYGYGGPESPRNGGRYSRKALVDRIDSGSTRGDLTAGTAAMENQMIMCDVCVPGACEKSSLQKDGRNGAIADETDFLLEQNPIFNQIRVGADHQGPDSGLSIGRALDDAIKNAGTRDNGRADHKMTRSAMESRQIFAKHLSKEFEHSMDKEDDGVDFPELDDDLDEIPAPPQLSNPNPFDDRRALTQSLSPIVEGDEALSPTTSPKVIPNLNSLPKEILNLESLSVSKVEKAMQPDIIDLTKMASGRKSSSRSPEKVVAPGNVIVGSVVNSPSQKGVNIQIGQDSSVSTYARETPKTRGGLKHQEFFDISKSESSASTDNFEVSRGYDGEGDVISSGPHKGYREVRRSQEKKGAGTTSEFAEGLFDLLPEDETRKIYTEPSARPASSPRKKKKNTNAEDNDDGVEVALYSPTTKDSVDSDQGLMCGALPLFFMFDRSRKSGNSIIGQDGPEHPHVYSDERQRRISSKKAKSDSNAFRVTESRTQRPSDRTETEELRDAQNDKVLLEKDDAYWDTLSTIASTKKTKESSDSDQYMYEYVEPGPIPNEITTLSPTSQRSENKSSPEVIELLEMDMSEESNYIPQRSQPQQSLNPAHEHVETDAVSKESRVADLIAIFEASQCTTTTGTISTKETGSRSATANDNNFASVDNMRPVTDHSQGEVYEITDLSHVEERDDALEHLKSKSNRRSPKPCPEMLMIQPPSSKGRASNGTEPKKSSRSISWGFEEIFESPVLSYTDADGDNKALFSAIAGAAAAAAAGAAETMGFTGFAQDDGRSVYSASTAMSEDEEQQLLERTLELSRSLLENFTPQDLSDPAEQELFRSLLSFVGGTEEAKDSANGEQRDALAEMKAAADDLQKRSTEELGNLVSQLQRSFNFQGQSANERQMQLATNKKAENRSAATVASVRSDSSPITLDDILEKKSQLKNIRNSKGAGARPQQTSKVQTSRLDALREKREKALRAFQRYPSSTRGGLSRQSLSEKRRNSTGSAAASMEVQGQMSRSTSASSKASSLEQSRNLTSQARARVLASRRSESTGRSNVDRASADDLASTSTTSSHASMKARELRKQLDEALQASQNIRASQEQLGSELKTFKQRFYTKNGEI